MSPAPENGWARLAAICALVGLSLSIVAAVIGLYMTMSELSGRVQMLETRQRELSDDQDIFRSHEHGAIDQRLRALERAQWGGADGR